MSTGTRAESHIARLRLHITPLRVWWSSALLWYATRWMDTAISSWLMLVLTNSPAQVALLGFYRVTPFLIFGLFSGEIIERFSRRTLLLVAQIVNGLTTGSITLLLITGQIAPWHVALAAFISGCIWALEWPVRRSTITDLVGFEHISPAIVFENILSGLMKIGAPLAAGALIAWYSLGSAYSAETVLFILSLVILLLARLPLQTRQPRQPNLFRQIAAGLRYIQKQQAILGVLAITVILNVFGFTYSQMLSVFARDVLSAGPTGLGLLSAMDGTGAFLGALLLRWFSARIRGSEGLLYLLGSFLMVCALLAFSLSNVFGLSAILIFVASFGTAAFSAFQSTLVLRTASLEMRSRALGVLVLCIGSGPIGSIFMSVLSAGTGPAIATAISASIGIAGVIVSALLFPALRKT